MRVSHFSYDTYSTILFLPPDSDIIVLTLFLFFLLLLVSKSSIIWTSPRSTTNLIFYLFIVGLTSSGRSYSKIRNNPKPWLNFWNDNSMNVVCPSSSCLIPIPFSFHLDAIVNQLQESLSVLSPELLPVHQKLVTIRRQLVALAAKEGSQKAELKPLQEELRRIDSLSTFPLFLYYLFLSPYFSETWTLLFLKLSRWLYVFFLPNSFQTPFTQ